MKDFTDGVNDFVHLTSEELVWWTLQSTGTMIKTTITKTDNEELDKILNVGLSGNKAVFLYSNGRIEYFKHTGNDQITMFFSKAYSKSDVDFETHLDRQYKLEISCMCASIDRMACFSATLNCVIIKKAGFKCHQTQDSTATW